jgi:hypothetical protein
MVDEGSTVAMSRRRMDLLWMIGMMDMDIDIDMDMDMDMDMDDSILHLGVGCIHSIVGGFCVSKTLRKVSTV